VRDNRTEPDPRSRAALAEHAPVKSSPKVDAYKARPKTDRLRPALKDFVGSKDRFENPIEQYQREDQAQGDDVRNLFEDALHRN
jgi:hypothetical protein